MSFSHLIHPVTFGACGVHAMFFGSAIEGIEGFDCLVGPTNHTSIRPDQLSPLTTLQLTLDPPYRFAPVISCGCASGALSSIYRHRSAFSSQSFFRFTITSSRLQLDCPLHLLVCTRTQRGLRLLAIVRRS